ncbi:MAG: hypothetical protein ACOC1F_12660 [Myxococcota bacterium]
MQIPWLFAGASIFVLVACTGCGDSDCGCASGGGGDGGAGGGASGQGGAAGTAGSAGAAAGATGGSAGQAGMGAAGGGTGGAAGVPEFAGTWVYAGASSFFQESTLVISETAMQETVINPDDTITTASYDVVAYDEVLDHVQFQVVSFSGAYPYAVGELISTTYVLAGDQIDLYYTTGSEYPAAEGGTEGEDYFTYEREP